MECKIGLVLYAIFQFIAFLFVLVATPIEMFRSRITPPGSKPMCMTLWGLKMSCDGLAYFLNTDEQWRTCPDRLARFRAAQGFAIISIVVYGTAFILGCIMLYCYVWLRWVCLGLNIAGIGTLCVVWASMVVTYRQEDDQCSALRIRWTFGAGFVLFVIAWCLDIVNIVFLLLPY